MSVSISDRISAYQTQCSQRDRKTLAAQGALRILAGAGSSGMRVMTDGIQARIIFVWSIRRKSQS